MSPAIIIILVYLFLRRRYYRQMELSGLSGFHGGRSLLEPSRSPCRSPLTSAENISKCLQVPPGSGDQRLTPSTLPPTLQLRAAAALQQLHSDDEDDDEEIDPCGS